MPVDAASAIEPVIGNVKARARMSRFNFVLPIDFAVSEPTDRYIQIEQELHSIMRDDKAL